METIFKIEEVVKGTKVIITCNPHNICNRYIIGTIEKTPHSWTKVSVRHWDPIAGEGDEDGAWVVKDFSLIHLIKPTPQDCAKIANNYKRLALEFNELRKTLPKVQS